MKHKDRALRPKPRGQKETIPEKGAPSDQFTIKLSEDQIKEVKEAQEARERGFLKLGYNLVLKQLR